jgi:hypothetical protein
MSPIERFKATTQIVVFLAAAVVVAGVICNKLQKKQKDRKNLLILLIGALPILVILLATYRHGTLFTVFISLGVLGVVELGIHWLSKHGKPDFKLKEGLFITSLCVCLLGISIMAFSVMYFLITYYISACEWIEKYILGR